MTDPASDTSPIPRKRSVFKRFFGVMWRWRPRFRLLDLIWLSLLSALLMTWYRDHQNLTSQLQARFGTARTSWSIDQLLGRPNTPMAGDQQSAWTTPGQNAGMQWFIVEFPNKVNVGKIEIVETYNPGAVVRICSVSMTGQEIEIWKGQDPVAPIAGMGSSFIVPSTKIRTRRMKVFLNTDLVSGWNEIDAVALHADDATVQWATNSWASESYGDNRESPQWYWP
ncbi:hypothetical protein Poly51_21300 [Rubripirellula tenax]|uniref:F5/8 type C domain protein n=1 Tax=Rubripirellula tenax TaxID=2528015 RepID=A0A5C6FF24_9BACT|nr:hypothetical protein [Rubripirellula tenax]TWU59342.1 hypothetical protein Poly51_21300 [Rubripirellula tenax]